MAEHMSLHPFFTPVAMWDPDPAACSVEQEFAPNAQVTITPEAAIAAADLVFLACPPVPLKAYALAAADAGKFLFLEKLLCVDVTASKAVVAHLEERKAPAAVNLPRRLVQGPAV